MWNQSLTIAVLSALSVVACQAHARALTHSPPATTASNPVPVLLSRSFGSLPNSTNIISPQATQGRGTLRVINGTTSDAAIKLVDRTSGRTLRFVYVQANHNVTISGISPCSCTLKFSTGTDWEQRAHKFLRNQSFAQFNNPLNFREIRTASGVKWMNYTVTLNPVLNGNARTTTISERNF